MYLFRAEKLALAKCPGKMKLPGSLLCVGGTMMVSLLKDPLLHPVAELDRNHWGSETQKVKSSGAKATLFS